MNPQRLACRSVVMFAECLAALLLVCFFSWSSASANEITYNFTATGDCAPSYDFACAGATLTATGTYTLDPILALTGGPGSVNLAFSFSVSSSNSQFGGFMINSTSPGAFSADVVGGAGPGTNILIFESNYPAVFDAPYSVTVQLAFGTPTAVDGSVLTGTTSSGVAINAFGPPTPFSAFFDFTAGMATPRGVTPEPASLFLVGTGLLGFIPFIRFHHSRT